VREEEGGGPTASTAADGWYLYFAVVPADFPDAWPKTSNFVTATLYEDVAEAMQAFNAREHACLIQVEARPKELSLWAPHGDPLGSFDTFRIFPDPKAEVTGTVEARFVMSVLKK